MEFRIELNWRHLMTHTNPSKKKDVLTPEETRLSEIGGGKDEVKICSFPNEDTEL